MMHFACHYRKERWQTAQYFDFVKDFLIAAQNNEYLDDCDPPPCPTPHTVIPDGMYLIYVLFICGLLFVLVNRVSILDFFGI